MDLRKCCLMLVSVLTLTTLLSAPTYGASGPDTASDPVVKNLLAKERASWDLAIKKDTSAYKALHTEGFVTVSADGVMDRAQSEAFALDPNVSFDNYALSDMHVDWVAADVVLITYRVKVSGTDHGKRFDGDAYASSFWVKQKEGGWLNAFYQATPASKK